MYIHIYIYIAGTNLYKTFSPDHFGQMKTNDLTVFIKKASTTQCEEDDILEHLILQNRFYIFVY